MARQTHSLTKAGLTVPVLIGIDQLRMIALMSKGNPIPSPIHARSLIDTGSNVTVISALLVQQLSLTVVFRTHSQTAGGLVPVSLYDISLSIPDPSGKVPSFVAPKLTVMELPANLADADVLIGLDLIALWRLNIDGPAQSFTLEY